MARRHDTLIISGREVMLRKDGKTYLARRVWTRDEWQREREPLTVNQPKGRKQCQG